MRRQSLLVVLVALGLTFTRVSTSAAQGSPKGPALGAYSGVITDASNTQNEIVGAWIYHFGRIQPDVTGTAPSFPTRVRQAAAAGLAVVPGIVGEVGLILSDSSLTFMAGPRVSIVPANQKVSAYGEFLIGGLHFSGEGFSGTDLLMMPAGGVLIAIPNSRLKICGEVGFPIESVEGFHQHATRVIGGVVFPLGRQ